MPNVHAVWSHSTDPDHRFHAAKKFRDVPRPAVGDEWQVAGVTLVVTRVAENPWRPSRVEVELTGTAPWYRSALGSVDVEETADRFRREGWQTDVAWPSGRARP